MRTAIGFFLIAAGLLIVIAQSTYNGVWLVGALTAAAGFIMVFWSVLGMRKS